MKRFMKQPRGFSMVMAMLIVVVATLLVVGAISFTGQERMAASAFERNAAKSACIQTARNLALSRARLFQGEVEALDPARPEYDPNRSVDAGLVVDSENPDRLMNIGTRHYTGSNTVTDAGTVIYHVTRAPKGTFQGDSQKAGDQTNALGGRQLIHGHYYVINATCQDGENGPEQEVEFVVRIGL